MSQCNAHRIRNRIRESTNSVARTRRSYFDKHIKGPKYAVDQHVWNYWPRSLVRQKNKKLTQIWTGPWTIKQFMSPLVVKIKHSKNNKIQTVHIDRLSPCLLPPPPSPIEEQTPEQDTLVRKKNCGTWTSFYAVKQTATLFGVLCLKINTRQMLTVTDCYLATPTQSPKN